MKFVKVLSILSLALLTLSLGCASKPPEKTATKEGIERWNLARAGVLYGLAKDQYESGNLDDCRKTLVNASKFAPDHVLIHLLSAKVSIEQGQLEAAEAQLNHVRELDAHNAEAEYLTGVVNQRWQKSQEAYDAYARAAEKNPNELAYVLAESEMLVQMDQNQKALQLLKDKLNFFENSPAIRDAVGQLLVQDGKFQEGSLILRQASSLAPEEQQIREHYGMALYYSKQYRESISVLDRLLKDEKYNKRADIHTAIGECQLEIDQPRDARDHFELASQLDPGTPRVWLNLAKTALRLNDLKRAELSLKKAMSMDPKSADANLLMGYLSLRQAEAMKREDVKRDECLGQALAAFRKASALDDKDPVSICMTGFVLEKMGRSDEAIRYYSTALKIKPNDELATSLLAKVQVGTPNAE
jgi:Flp pilus assembly protein TadD